jgi:predicted acyltransferase (DUF342 family)
MGSWAPLELATVTAALLAVPVTPALYELLKRRDAAPLHTSGHDGHIENFADAFIARLEPLRTQMELCCAEATLSRSRSEDLEVLLVGLDEFDFNPSLLQGIKAVMCAKNATVPAEALIQADVYADGSLELGRGATLRAGMSARDIVLGKNSAVLRWLHAVGSIYLRAGSAAYGRLSAGQSIRLEPDCKFQRMHAPQIVTVDSEEDDTGPIFVSGTPGFVSTTADTASEKCDDAGADDVAFNSRRRLRIQGDFVLRAGETLNANVIATGELRLAAGSRLFGNSKGYKNTVVEDDARVQGSLVCRETVRIGKHCFVKGPVIAEGEVFIDRGSRVGAPNALTTITSSGIRIATGCTLHGTVWARVQGNVEG